MHSKFPPIVSLPKQLGREMYELVSRLYPINRSITGPGLRETFRILSDSINLSIHEVKTGTQVFDWQVPNEWTIRDAYIADDSGRKIVDYQQHNLHVVGYSTPVRATMSLEQLKPHLHTLPEHPKWIPYRTSYYNENWGFCLSHEILESMTPGNYQVVIDSDLTPGSLTYGEFVAEGESDEEILFFAHTCHPSLCNDNLSGIAVATRLASLLAKRPNRYTFRFVFAPATIGSITWLSRNEDRLSKIKGGLVLSVIGDRGDMVYKNSRHGDSLMDQAASHVLRSINRKADIRDFLPWGYDERQFCSPGINLPMGRLTRTPNGEFPEYHTSADNLDFVTPEAMEDSLKTLWRIIEVLENNDSYINTQPKGEPQLGRRGLYNAMGGYQNVAERQLAMLWVLNQSDGTKSLLDIAIASQIPFSVVHSVAMELANTKLLKLK